MKDRCPRGQITRCNIVAGQVRERPSGVLITAIKVLHPPYTNININNALTIPPSRISRVLCMPYNIHKYIESRLVTCRDWESKSGPPSLVFFCLLRPRWASSNILQNVCVSLPLLIICNPLPCLSFVLHLMFGRRFVNPVKLLLLLIKLSLYGKARDHYFYSSLGS